MSEMNLRSRQRNERRIVRKLIRHLGGRGFALRSADDGEEAHFVKTEAKALGVVFSVDEAWLRFAKVGGAEHTVALVCGNDEDIVSDWSFGLLDEDGFNDAMEAFEPTSGDGEA